MVIECAGTNFLASRFCGGGRLVAVGAWAVFFAGGEGFVDGERADAGGGFEEAGRGSNLWRQRRFWEGMLTMTGEQCEMVVECTGTNFANFEFISGET